MKRRLDLALALVHDPRILFLDEPTTGLDPASRVGIWEEVRRLNDELGMTIFLTTQYLEEADRLADEIAIINKGKIVAAGHARRAQARGRRRGRGAAVRQCEEAEQAYDALAAIAPNRQATGHELRLYFGRAAENVPELVRALDGAGIRLQGLTIEQPSPGRRLPARHRRGARARGRRGGRRGLRLARLSRAATHRRRRAEEVTP